MHEWNLRVKGNIFFLTWNFPPFSFPLLWGQESSKFLHKKDSPYPRRKESRKVRIVNINLPPLLPPFEKELSYEGEVGGGGGRRRGQNGGIIN